MSVNDSGEVTDELAGQLIKRHRWAATGVSDYPPRDPLVGQSRFFKRFRNFLHTVDHEDDHFAHVFAVEAEWGRGKSRLGHELVAQINDCSQGWYVRENSEQLQNQQLFDIQTQDHYLALYIRYSQVASDYQNSDNWFAYGLYKALLPLATEQFDQSIQSSIAEQALQRLRPIGFESAVLAVHLKLAEQYSEEDLYEDPVLVVKLVQAAYTYLEQFGIRYVLVVLDELETVAEAATFGLEDDDSKRLDGQAIRLIGKAIKEEDPRRKLPWLRYVALCSPLLGQQLREIQSVARRFELVELEHNAFADVSDYVRLLDEEGRLGFVYPTGLVEAAYAMSGANFGWFNVVMANVDSVLENGQARDAGHIGHLFEAVLDSSGRVADHVLDAGAIEGIQTRDQSLLAAARNLLYGQLPLPLADVPLAERLITLLNEDQEPIASCYRKLTLDKLSCRQALEQAKFRREQDEWFYPAVEQALSLDTLLNNLRTFSIREQDKDAVLLPLSRNEFKYLLNLLYDHPAIEYAADALWQKLVGDEHQLPDEEATHIGASISMLLRLDLRYRNAQQNSMIFRDPDFADQHERAMACLLTRSSQRAELRFAARLSGVMRLLDNHWVYDQPLLPNPDDLPIVTDAKGSGPGQRGGLLTLDAFKLHPDAKAWFAWVNNREELDKLHQRVTMNRADSGRIPVLALTASVNLIDQYSRGSENERLRDDILLHYLNPSEIDQIERIGLSLTDCQGFVLKPEVFTARFRNKLAALNDFIIKAIHDWRSRLQRRGLIAWPLKVTGKLSQAERELLFQGWQLLAVKEPALGGLLSIEKRHGVDAEEMAGLLQKLAVPNKLLAQGFQAEEQAGLFSGLANPQQAEATVPLFLARIASPAVQQHWTIDKARQNWYWGYVAQTGLTAKMVFDDWMWWCGQLNLLQSEATGSKKVSWHSYPRAKLDNAINEAQIWFSGEGKDGYKARIDVLNRVFGFGRIGDLFSPLGTAQAGTETVKAKDKLAEARQLFTQLKSEEENLAPDASAVVTFLPALLKKRLDILDCVESVYPLERQQIILANVHTLSLEDKNQALYQRIERARLFAEHVEQNCERIERRIEQLIVEVEQDSIGLEHFPKSLFKLSLQTVNNILQGALSGDDGTDTAKIEGHSSSDTLSHFLRSLELDKADERLRLLAAEAGLSLDNESQQAFMEVSGYILTSYRSCKDIHQKTRQRIQNLQSQVTQSKALLTPLPDDYDKGEHLQTLIRLNQKLMAIEDALSDVSDEAKRERISFQEQMRKGRFIVLRDVPERLFRGIRSQLHPIGGELLKIENALKAYSERKLAMTNALLPVIRPLFAACHQDLPENLTLSDLEGLNLAEVTMLTENTGTQWIQRAELLLQPAGLVWQDWQQVVQAINDREEPVLSTEQREQLVAHGILKMQLTFGG